MYESIMQAYDKAKRQAALRGIPLSKDDVLRTLAPIYAQYAQDATTQKGIALKDKALKQNADQFSVSMNNARHNYDSNMPLNYANIALAGLGTLGAGLYSNQQEDLMRRRLALLEKQFGGKG